MSSARPYAATIAAAIRVLMVSVASRLLAASSSSPDGLPEGREGTRGAS